MYGVYLPEEMWVLIFADVGRKPLPSSPLFWLDLECHPYRLARALCALEHVCTAWCCHLLSVRSLCYAPRRVLCLRYVNHLWVDCTEAHWEIRSHTPQFAPSTTPIRNCSKICTRGWPRWTVRCSLSALRRGVVKCACSNAKIAALTCSVSCLR